MDAYITGSIIRQLREEKHMTQLELAEKLMVSDKTVSKWETGRGLPDISLLEPIAQALGHSVPELLSGSSVTNRNRSFNLNRIRLYVCPVCGNIITAGGDAVITCCGVTLPPLEAEAPDQDHMPLIETVEDEYYITLPHPMTKEHFISFMAVIRFDSLEMVKLYPEGNAEARFRLRGARKLLWYCSRHGLFELPLHRAKTVSAR